MIYYTVITNSSLNKGQVVQKNNDNTFSVNDGTGIILGVVMSCTQIPDTTNYELVIYAAGGGGVKIKLANSWDGHPSRFEYLNDGITPVTTGGVGVLVPSYPIQSYNAGDLVDGALYK
jgi:hypothetical protein